MIRTMSLLTTEWAYALSMLISAMPGEGGLLPYMGYIGMCSPKGYGFSAVLVINRVSILADFGHFGLALMWVCS